MLAPHYGVQKMAQSGDSAQGWVQNKANRLAFLRFLAGFGYAPDAVVNALGTNDFLQNLNQYALRDNQSFINQVFSAIRGIFPQIPRIAATVLPCSKSAATSNRFTTVAEQQPYNANFAVGGIVDQYNADLRSGSGSTIPHELLIDGNIAAKDANYSYAWRTDAYPASGATAYCGTDGSDSSSGTTYYFGIHPIPPVGIPHLVKSVAVPQIAPAPFVSGSAASQQATIGQPFSYSVPSNAFADTLGQTLSYSASLADGSALPSWLSINTATGALSGTPAWQNRARLTVRITAKNTAGRSAILPVPIAVDSGLAFISKIYVRSDNPNQLTLTGTNNQISKWADASGNGFDLTQNTVLRQPRYVANAVDGHGAIRGRWDGTNASQLTHVTTAC